MNNLITESSDKLNGAAREVNSTVKDGFKAAKSTIEHLSHNIGEQASSAVTKAQEAATEYYNDSRKYVVENPVKGVAIAAAAGLIFGGLLSMAWRKR